MFHLVMEHSPNQPIPTFFCSKLSVGVPYYNFFKVLFWLKRWIILSDNHTFQKTVLQKIILLHLYGGHRIVSTDFSVPALLLTRCVFCSIVVLFCLSLSRILWGLDIIYVYIKFVMYIYICIYTYSRCSINGNYLYLYPEFQLYLPTIKEAV